MLRTRGGSWGCINNSDIKRIASYFPEIQGGVVEKKELSILNKHGLYLIAILAMFALLGGCTGRDAPIAANFVGKWKSSRMISTPVHLYGDNEWEIISDDGAVMQYGVWQYKDNRILWSFKTAEGVIHDKTRVLSVTPDEFRIRERDGSTTIFSRLE